MLRIASITTLSCALAGSACGSSLDTCCPADESAAISVQAPPPIPQADRALARKVLAAQGDRQDDAAAVRRIRREYFGSVRLPERRAEGLAKLSAFTGQGSIEPLYRELRREAKDVVQAMLTQIASIGEAGQAALAWIAVNDDLEELRRAAAAQLNRPATPAVLGVLDTALRSDNHMIANRAGSLAGTLGAIETIPLLIFAQSQGRDETSAQSSGGGLAWISFLHQRSYVANLVPVVGDNSGAFQPIIGVINEGAVLEITDAVVISYRTEVHTSLVQLTSADWGSSTSDLGYDTRAWLSWYREVYLPFKERQAEEAERIAQARKGERRDDYDEDL